MLQSIEEFCKAHEHTISALEAFSTLLAVIVSLALAYRASLAEKTRLLAKLEIATILHPAVSPHPRFVVVSITNIGNLPLQVTLGFFRWRVPFARRQWVILPIDSTGVPGVVPQKVYPVEIKPRSSETFYMSEASAFLEQMQDIKKQQTIVGRCLFCFRRAVVGTADGRRFRPKGDRGIIAAAGEADG